MSIPVWTYWDSGTPPAAIGLCLETIAQHHPTLTVVSVEWLRGRGRQDILDATAQHSLAHRADLVRFWLLREFGGLWLGADCVCLQPVTMPSLLAGDAAMACPPWPDNGRRSDSPQRRCVSNTIAAVAGSPIAAEAFRRCRQFLATHPRGSFFWAEPSDVLLESLLTWWTGPGRLVTPPRSPHRYSPWERVAAIRDPHPDCFYAADPKLGSPTLEVSHLCLGTYRAMAGKSRDELLSDRSFLGFLFRRGLGLAPLNDPVPAAAGGGGPSFPALDRRDEEIASRLQWLYDRRRR
jgi:hypothetical protein